MKIMQYANYHNQIMIIYPVVIIITMDELWQRLVYSTALHIGIHIVVGKARSEIYN